MPPMHGAPTRQLSNETPQYQCRCIQMTMQVVRVCMLCAKQDKGVSLNEKKCNVHNADEYNGLKTQMSEYVLRYRLT